MLYLSSEISLFDICLSGGGERLNLGGGACDYWGSNSFLGHIIFPNQA